MTTIEPALYGVMTRPHGDTSNGELFECGGVIDTFEEAERRAAASAATGAGEARAVQLASTFGEVLKAGPWHRQEHPDFETWLASLTPEQRAEIERTQEMQRRNTDTAEF